MNISAGKPKQDKPGKQRGSTRTRDDYEFLPAALEILETPASPIRVAILWFICILAASALLWTWLGTFDIVATAQGKIQPSGRVKIIQSLESGRTVSLPLENGTRVAAGDILVQLDAAEIMAEIAAVSANLAAREAEAIRRRALNDIAAGVAVARGQNLRPGQDAGSLPFPASVPERIRQRERLQYEAEFGDLYSNLASIQAKRVQLSAEIDRLEETVAAREALVTTLSERVGMRSTLEEAKVGSRASVIDATEMRQKEEAELIEQQGQLREARSKIGVLDREAEQIVSSFKAENAAKLSDAERQIDELRQNLVAAEKRLERMTIKSPVSGTVQTSSVSVVGQVVNAGTELMRIVPSDAALEIEAYIPNRDIGFLREGQPAVIKIEAFPFTRYGVIEGTLVRIGTDAIPEPDAQTLEQSSTLGQQGTIPTGNAQRMQNLVFPVTIAPDKTSLAVEGQEFGLSAGMAVTVEIKTGRRRILEYLLSPLEEISSEAMKER